MGTPGLGSKLRKAVEGRNTYRAVAAKFAFMLTGNEDEAAQLLREAVRSERANNHAQRDAK